VSVPFVLFNYFSEQREAQLSKLFYIKLDLKEKMFVNIMFVAVTVKQFFKDGHRKRS
jgi:hypothetical protein